MKKELKNLKPLMDGIGQDKVKFLSIKEQKNYDIRSNFCYLHIYFIQ